MVLGRVCAFVPSEGGANRAGGESVQRCVSAKSSSRAFLLPPAGRGLILPERSGPTVSTCSTVQNQARFGLGVQDRARPWSRLRVCLHPPPRRAASSRRMLFRGGGGGVRLAFLSAGRHGFPGPHRRNRQQTGGGSLPSGSRADTHPMQRWGGRGSVCVLDRDRTGVVSVGGSEPDRDQSVCCPWS